MTRVAARQLPVPRLVIGGLSGDSGKTLVSLAILQRVRAEGLLPRAFKKGPDYIDAAWLTWAAGHPARHLDTFLMGTAGVQERFARYAPGADLVVVEGNRGLFDGVDARGTHSTAELAKAIDAPVLLVVNAAKTTRTVAAQVLGCQRLDPDVRIAGVVLNRVSGPRHERLIRDAVESVCGIPVVGVVPRVSDTPMLPGRHLGLVPPTEHGGLHEVEALVLQRVAPGLAMADILRLARSAPPIVPAAEHARTSDAGRGLRIGYLCDSAFTFYYPENLEQLSASGAELVSISSLSDRALPPGLHGLYIGGGFPETHAVALAANRAFLEDLRRQAERGLPIYAECGGLMLLAGVLRQESGTSPMAGVLPFDVELCPTPQGHGYAELTIDTPNLFFPVGLSLRGHEFHYSRIAPAGLRVPTVAAVVRGTGSTERRDGIVVGHVWASYVHVHAAATPEWARGVLSAARDYSRAGVGRPEPGVGARS